MYNIRHFNKEKYYLDSWYESKEEAMLAAERIRATGRKARIMPAPDEPYYLVYYRLE